MPNTCNICGKPHSAPLQRLVAGIIVEQCVARCHDGHVYASAPSNRYWFLHDAKTRFRTAGVTRSKG